ncbi:MAG: H-NS histone family protein [Rhodobacter sp.]|uniref:H-NS histone family protein n=1 Tax=Pararhodobacter sp. TaxID=2127056 RepID=UPI001D8691BB|nr:H-NS histone family protein [Pararhodobacter sp.]MCB1346958.1 H-NS histone family protein [Paracoccaceae bacterium]MCC0072382.1 H-NS histone family protein [Rhodobacter sp.]HPD91483.1 H-NS histone family protein [Pararhodobacter sp.]
MDLDSLSLAELKQLRKDVEAAITDFTERERRKALAEVEAFARERGLSPADLASLGVKRTRKPAAPKYANPADPSQTWTGRGRRPHWIEAALSAGKSLDDLAI